MFIELGLEALKKRESVRRPTGKTGEYALLIDTPNLARTGFDNDITKRHLASHGMTSGEYREKWGFKKDAPLVCKALQRERRKKMKDMKLWEKRRKVANP